MSNSRIFCIAYFVGTGAIAAFSNHVLDQPSAPINALPLLLMGTTFGAMAVAFFGDRRS